MNRALSALSTLAALTLAGSIFADEPPVVSETTAPVEAKQAAATPSAKASSEAPTVTPPAIDKDTPRDPAGIQGVSPFWEQIVGGDAAYLARDFAAAQKSYQAAITMAPKSPTGHLRMAELRFSQGKLDEAQSFVESALRFSEGDLRAKAQASFVAAKLREQQKMPDEAIVSWRTYKSLASQLPKTTAPSTEKGPAPARIYEKSADSRIAAIERAKALNTDYAQVRERIKKGLDDAEEATGGK